MKKAISKQRRVTSLSRAQIIEASVEILDSGGMDGLTFRALAGRLETGAGAIYWHIEDKSDLLTAACDAIVAHTVQACSTADAPGAAIRKLALGIFDAIDAHPWVGSALTHGAGQLPMVRIVECLGQHVCALGVGEEGQWAAVSALLHYILGVAGQNAANTQFGLKRGIERAEFLDAMANLWSQLEPDEFPFARSIAGHVRAHDDRVDFLAGIDFILGGLESTHRA